VAWIKSNKSRKIKVLNLLNPAMSDPSLVIDRVSVDLETPVELTPAPPAEPETEQAAAAVETDHTAENETDYADGGVETVSPVSTLQACTDGSADSSTTVDSSSRFSGSGSADKEFSAGSEVTKRKSSEGGSCDHVVDSDGNSEQTDDAKYSAKRQRIDRQGEQGQGQGPLTTQVFATSYQRYGPIIIFFGVQLFFSFRLFYRREQNRLHARKARERKKLQLDQSHNDIYLLLQEVCTVCVVIKQTLYKKLTILLSFSAEDASLCYVAWAYW
jgi:hypothetical protein